MWALVPLVVEKEKYKQWSLEIGLVVSVPTLCPGAYTDPVRGGVHKRREQHTHSDETPCLSQGETVPGCWVGKIPREGKIAPSSSVLA